jgi:hypothetical protein
MSEDNALRRYIDDVANVVLEAILFAAASKTFRRSLTKEERETLDAFVAHIETKLTPEYARHERDA